MSRNNLWFVLSAAENRRVAEATIEDDARLIAAAPDLLDACRRLISFNEALCADVKISTHYPSADFARDAVAKAEGRS